MRDTPPPPLPLGGLACMYVIRQEGRFSGVAYECDSEIDAGIYCGMKLMRGGSKVGGTHGFHSKGDWCMDKKRQPVAWSL